MKQPHMFTAEVLEYWRSRSESAVARLKDHGIPASCSLTTEMRDDGEVERRFDFQMGSFGTVLLAEMLCDKLDGVRQAVLTRQAQLLAKNEVEEA